MFWNAKLSPSETGHCISVLNRLNRSYTLITAPSGGLNTLLADIHEDDLLLLSCDCGAMHDKLNCPHHKVLVGQMEAHEMLGKDFY